MLFLKITRDTFIAGEHVTAGTEVEVDALTAKILLESNKAVQIEAPAAAAIPEPPKPKFRKVAKAAEPAE